MLCSFLMLTCTHAQAMGLNRPASPAVDDWEIDITQLQIDAKVRGPAEASREQHRSGEPGEPAACMGLRLVGGMGYRPGDCAAWARNFLTVKRAAALHHTCPPALHL